MLFRQFVDDDLGCASYLVGDEETGEAVLVDPAYAIEPYLAEADRFEVRILSVLETHTHADHVSGHGRLALEHGLPVAIHHAAGVTYPSSEFEDGETIELGEVALRALHTPGHRPEHCCFTVTDRSRGDQPWLVLTGDSLFVGDAGRPDLAVAATEGAHELFRSLRRLLELADGVEVFPGHVAGSLCGAGMSSKASSTIGFERAFNPALLETDEQAFVEEAGHVSTPRPPTMERVVEINRGAFFGASPPLERLSSTGAGTVLDVRTAEEFARGHVPGALNIPLARSGLGTKAGFVFRPDESIVIQAASDAHAFEVARRLRAAGLFELAGYVTDAQTTARLHPVELDELERLLAADAVEVIDVREKDERDAGYIPGSRHIPYRLLRAYDTELENGRPLVTICESGARATLAASILSAGGVEARPVLHGGIPEWQARGNQTVTFRRCGS